MILGYKRTQKPRTNIFWIFTDFHEVMWVQSPNSTELSSVASVALKSSIFMATHLKVIYYDIAITTTNR